MSHSFTSPSTQSWPFVLLLLTTPITSPFFRLTLLHRTSLPSSFHLLSRQEHVKMVRDSLIVGSHLRRPFTPGGHGIDEISPLQSSSWLSTAAQSGRLLSPNRGDDRSSMLTISRISINAPLSSLNLAQVDPADLPPPLVIDKQNRLVTDPRSARSLLVTILTPSWLVCEADAKTTIDPLTTPNTTRTHRMGQLHPHPDSVKLRLHRSLLKMVVTTFPQLNPCLVCSFPIWPRPCKD